MSAGLWRYSVFGGMLAMAGLPIYIHAPKVYADEYGVSLTALGTALFALRLIDFGQDPVFGWLVQRNPAKRWAMVLGGGILMAASMLGLFALTPPIASVLWFALTMAGLFSGFSLLTIAFYAQGVSKADHLGAHGHTRLAGWRETGALVGVILAALAPTLLEFTGSPYASFALVFAAVTGLALILMSREWTASRSALPSTSAGFWHDAEARRLLIVALLNATPVAITSTLFLFFVESRLGAAEAEGLLLIVFFLSAAVAAPVWSWLAKRWHPKRALLAAMALSTGSFAFALTLGTGDVAGFALICVLTGFATGADLTLLPALFAKRLSVIAPEAGQAFGIWAFVNKFALAFAAIALLPLLEFRGFENGPDNTEAALNTLTLLYAGVPCALKLAAFALLATTRLTETR